MLEIKTGVFLGVFIDGVEYPLEKNGFQRLALVSNKRMSTATCEITFSDLTNRINTSVTLADGVTIMFKLGRSAEEFDVYRYRVYNYKRDLSKVTPQYTVYGYFDAPLWFLKAWRKPIEGTSSAALSELAGASGLQTDCDPSNDDMLWLPGNERSCMFARSIAERGWQNDRSAMSIGMTLDGIFKYKNLTTLPTSGPVFTHGSVPGTANVIDMKYTTASGFGNSIGGYRHFVRPQLLHEERETLRELQIQRKTQTFQLSKEVRGMVSKGRIDFGEIDGGNVHKHWDKARYQNLRTAMLYSMGVELMIDQRTPLDLDLFSPITYKPYEPPVDGEATPAQQWSSVYYVTAKAIYVEMGNYYEKFQGYTTGINTDPDGRGSQE